MHDITTIIPKYSTTWTDGNISNSTLLTASNFSTGKRKTSLILTNMNIIICITIICILEPLTEKPSENNKGSNSTDRGEANTSKGGFILLMFHVYSHGLDASWRLILVSCCVFLCCWSGIVLYVTIAAAVTLSILVVVVCFRKWRRHTKPQAQVGLLVEHRHCHCRWKRYETDTGPLKAQQSHPQEMW